MAARLRSLLLAAAIGSIAALAVPGVAQGQEVPTSDATATTVAIGGVSETTAVGESTVVDEGPDTVQEVTEGTTTESSLFTESRKVLATIAGLVISALALTLLTIRYWRATRPVPVAVEGAGRPLAPGGAVTGTAAALARAELPQAEPATAAAPVASADHPRADADYEPQGTGEHARVELPPPAVGNRPGRDARRAALGRSAPA